MIKLRTWILAVGFLSFASFSQDLDLESLPTATLTEDFYLTLDPSVPVAEYYLVDISHMGFTTEAEAIKSCRNYLSGNLISNQVFFSENYLIVHIHTEYLGGDLDYAKVQNYLNQLSKPH